MSAPGRPDFMARHPGAVTPLLAAIVFVVTLVVLFMGAAKNAAGLLSFAIPWVFVAVVAGTRPLWDPNFYDGDRVFGSRVARLLWRHYGIIGLAVTVLFNVQLSVVSDHADPPGWFGSAGYFVAVAACGVVLIASRRPLLSQVGAGLLVGIAVLGWAVFLVVGIFLVLPSLVLYGAVSVFAWLVARRRFNRAVVAGASAS